MNTYQCKYRTHEIEVQEESWLDAKHKAMQEFRKLEGRRKVWYSEVIVMLSHKDGVEVVHSTGGL